MKRLENLITSNMEFIPEYNWKDLPSGFAIICDSLQEYSKFLLNVERNNIMNADLLAESVVSLTISYGSDPKKRFVYFFPGCWEE